MSDYKDMGRSRLIAEIESLSHWRDLALQFDNHRMEALWHLKRVLADENQTEQAQTFLSKPPLSAGDIVSERDQLKAENESLRADIRKITRERGRLTLENENLKVEMSSAQRDIYSLGIDAKRYRWIKNNAAVTLRKTVYYMSGTSYIGTIYPNQSDLDLAIDTAISSPENP